MTVHSMTTYMETLLQCIRKKYWRRIGRGRRGSIEWERESGREREKRREREEKREEREREREKGGKNQTDVIPQQHDMKS